jgi:hypothetical protein
MPAVSDTGDEPTPSAADPRGVPDDVVLDDERVRSERIVRAWHGHSFAAVGGMTTAAEIVSATVCACSPAAISAFA